MLPDTAGGVDFLFGESFSNALQTTAERVAVAYNIAKEEAIEELRRFLAIKAFTCDKYAVKISPTPLMDELWHILILDTIVYHDPQNALQLSLYRRPSGASDEESQDREKRLAVMKAIYKIYFSTDPIEARPVPRPPKPSKRSNTAKNVPVSLEVRNLNGKQLTVVLMSHGTIDHLKTAIQIREGYPSDQQSLDFRRRQLFLYETLQDCSIRDGSVIHVVLRLGGC